ncbi:MAG: hypothetical protein ACTIJJ_06990 [Galactobacter sp.]
MGITTRSLLVCVVLGAFTGVLIHLGRFVGWLTLSTAPWFGSPSALIPWYLMILVAALLIPRFGPALITGLVGTAIGVGTMALVAAVCVEIVFALARLARRSKGGLRPGDRAGLWWAMSAGILAGASSYSAMFTIQEFQDLPDSLQLLGLAIRIVTGALWGWLAHLIVLGLLKAGYRPDAATAVVADEGTTR